MHDVSRERPKLQLNVLGGGELVDLDESDMVRVYSAETVARLQATADRRGELLRRALRARGFPSELAAAIDAELAGEGDGRG